MTERGNYKRKSEKSDKREDATIRKRLGIMIERKRRRGGEENGKKGNCGQMSEG